jgi:hypothetical protein
MSISNFRPCCEPDQFQPKQLMRFGIDSSFEAYLLELLFAPAKNPPTTPIPRIMFDNCGISRHFYFTAFDTLNLTVGYVNRMMSGTRIAVIAKVTITPVKSR